MMDHLFLLLLLLSPRWLNGCPSIENIQPLIAQNQVPIDEPDVAPKPKPTIPYLSRANKQKLREKDDNLALKFVEIFRNLHFELSFADALLHMPKFDLMFKIVDYVIDPRVPLILGRPFLRNGRALIDVYGEELTLHVNDEAITFKLGQTLKYSYNDVESINQIDVIDIAFVDYVIDPRVPLILGRPFLRNGRALIDVYGEELTLHVNDEAITFKLGQTLKYSYNDVESINQIDVIDIACEEYVQESVHCVPKKGGMIVVENEDNELIPTRLVTGWRVCIDYRNLNDATRKDHFSLPFMDQMLERLAENEFYCFLDGFYRYFHILINLQDQEKTSFTFPYGTFAYRHMPFGLCNDPGTFQRCMLAIFHDMTEKTMEVFMDDFSVFGDSFSSCHSHLDKMLQ
nr:reverse transcriptase domain-containing protein [Tanacetum cinerariifolium]